MYKIPYEDRERLIIKMSKILIVVKIVVYWILA